jgi:predicted permease
MSTNLKLAIRTLRKSPFVTIVAVASLALGIGANTAIFSIFNQFLLRSLPVQDPSRLVNISAPGPKPGSQSCNQAGDCDDVLSYPMFRDLEGAQSAFTGVAAHRLFGANLAYRGQTLSGEGLFVSGSYFPLLGTQPALGRLLGPNDDRTIGEALVAVLSHGWWQSRFGADPNVLNDNIVVNGQSLTIVGVAPRDFIGTTLGATPQVFVPITLRGLLQPGFNGFQDRRQYWIYAFARLKPGMSREQAATAINVPYRQILADVEAPLQTGMSDQTMARFKAKGLELEDGWRGQSSVHREARTPLLLLLGVTALVLLTACANIANLLLARAAARASEMAIRLSIGASRLQLVSQLLVESCLLALLGGIAGMLVARWTVDFIASILPDEAAATMPSALDSTVLLFAALLTVGTGVLFGLFPALHSTRPDLASTLKGLAGQPAGARSAQRFRTTLATAQIALSMMLLACAGLFTKSLWNVSRVDLGIKTDNVVTFGISPELNAYTSERSRQLFVRLEEELSAMPGVTGVTTALVPLLAGSNWGSDVRVEGFQSGPDIDSNSRFNEVGPGYFRTMGVPLIAGREFTPGDVVGSPKVAIVNEAFARKFNLGRDAVGKRMGSGRRDEPMDVEIVGLAQNAKYSDVKREVPPLFFRPYRQDDEVGSLTFYVRTAVDPSSFLVNIPKVAARLDANLPVENLRTLTEQVQNNIFLDRLMTTMSAAFASLATLLAAIGLYGVLAYTVAQRTREIGLRMALGAAPGRVRSMVLRQVAMMTAIGGVLGLTAAVLAGRGAQSLLYQLQGSDPLVLGASAVILVIVALGAGLVPAHRAARLDPMTALRYE